ncbi:MAG: chemotaxis protein CheX [Planctomycetota bacterium]
MTMIEQVSMNDVFLDSAKEIFETMIFMDMMEADDADQQIEGDAVLGSITFKGQLEGCLGICCSEACAQTVTMNMLGFDSIDEVTEDDTSDAMGEICNMVMGCVKKRLHDYYGDNIELSIPVVVNGSQLRNTLGEGASAVTEKVIIEDEFPAELSLLYREKSH